MKTEAVWASIEAMTFGGAKEAEVHEDSDEEMDLPGADDGKGLILNFGSFRSVSECRNSRHQSSC